MARRKKREKLDDPSREWETSYKMTINGRFVEPGTELKIRGARGRFRFIKHVKTTATEWVDVWGGPKHQEQWRSFHVDAVQRVHYKNTTTKALAAEYKAKIARKSEADEVDG